VILDYYKQAFNSVGWFIPPYVTLGFLGALAKKINDNGKALDQQELEKILALIYSPENLAAMVTERYPIPVKEQVQVITCGSHKPIQYFFLNHPARITVLLPDTCQQFLSSGQAH
jgi:hypothetical protein